MAHVEITGYGTPKQHERIMNWLSSRKYPLEGKRRRGYNKPYISEFRQYDIRIRKECIEYLLEDIRHFGGNMMVRSKGNNEHHYGYAGRIVRFLMKIITKLTPLKEIDVGQYRKSDADIPNGWYMMQVWGKIDDPDSCEGEHL